MKRQFYIIGAGVGAHGQLTNDALRLMQKADAVYCTSSRLAQAFTHIRSDLFMLPFHTLAQAAADGGAQICALLVSGDTGFFSAAGALQKALSEFGEVYLLPGISSMQYFCAKLGTGYEDMVFISLHGRAGNILGAASYARRVFVLTGGENTAGVICASLCEAGLGGLKISVGTNLSLPDESIKQGSAADFCGYAPEGLTVLLIENEHPADRYQPVWDKDVIRGSVPMTKEEIRLYACAKLELCPEDIVYDIGAGTGSVTMELARHAHRGRVYAVEYKAEGAELIARNREKFGAYHAQVVQGKAPEVLASLPAPDAVFIGGSGGTLGETLARILAKNAKVRVVITAVTLETLHAGVQEMQRLGFADTEVVQIAGTHGKQVGGYTMMTANNPVYIISGRGSNET